MFWFVFRHLVTMKVATTPEDKNFECKQTDCCIKFKHKTQLHWHKKKCSAICPIKKKKGFYAKEGNHYHFKKCGKQYSYQSE